MSATVQFTPSARERFKVTVEQIEAGEIYPLCPRCRGERLISVCTDPGGDYRPSQWEYVNCPCCSATGEAPSENAIEFIATWQEARDAESSVWVDEASQITPAGFNVKLPHDTRIAVLRGRIREPE